MGSSHPEFPLDWEDRMKLASYFLNSFDRWQSAGKPVHTDSVPILAHYCNQLHDLNIGKVEIADEVVVVWRCKPVSKVNVEQTWCECETASEAATFAAQVESLIKLGV